MVTMTVPSDRDGGPPAAKRGPAVSPFASPRLTASREDEDEYRHRMRVNCCAAIAIFVLLAIGVWLTSAMVETHRVHGCYASGDRTCSSI